jgi:dienelactone hydrolase
VEASDRAVSALKARSGAETLVLVGFSGGGTIAALLAARRSDVARIVTVAGNLDIAASAAHHRVPALAASLNPADDWARLQSIPQLHFVGEKDRVAPPKLAEAYADRFPGARRPAIRVVPEFTHSCCWAAEWPRLAREAFP